LDLLRHLCAINASERVSDKPEIAETRLKCARIYYTLGYYQEALRMLNEAIGRYNAFPHQHAVAKWMKGCVWAQFPERRDDVIIEWRQSCREFEGQSSGLTANKDQADWYRNRCQEMTEAIKVLIRQDGAGRPASHEIKGWVVLDQIPAGTTTRKQLTSHIVGKVMVENLYIERRPYVLETLPGKAKEIELRRNYYVLKVSGDSMDKLGIENGGYVLLRPGVDAEEQDIVACDVDGKDTCAVLRRYSTEDRKVILSTQSTNVKNAAYNRQSFYPGSNDYRIHGVVVGVFKPA
jgi:SOS-response transcriptional repressor LexA